MELNFEQKFCHDMKIHSFGQIIDDMERQPNQKKVFINCLTFNYSNAAGLVKALWRRVMWTENNGILG